MVPRPLITRFLATALLPLLFSVASAQADAPTQAPISFGTTVYDTITDPAAFDIWEFAAVTGEQYRADMHASDGLAPLLGLRDPAGDVETASNILEDGSTLDAEPDSTATLFFEITRDGLFALIATRVGRNEGTTTGSYSLTLTLLSGPPTPDNTYVDVVFRCDSQDVTTAFVIEFGDQSELGGGYTITAYGLDGFDPVIRLGGDDGSSDAPCNLGTPPADDPLLVIDTGAGEPESLTGVSISGAAVYTLAQADTRVRITVGSRDGRPGRYVLRIQGLAVESAGDVDAVSVRIGPRATAESVMLWMLRDGLSRLDPNISGPESIGVCADVALRSCPLEFFGAAISYRSNLGAESATDRLDSVAYINPGSTDPVELSLASQNGRATGAYVLWAVGALPSQ